MGAASSRTWLSSSGSVSSKSPSTAKPCSAPKPRVLRAATAARVLYGRRRLVLDVAPHAPRHLLVMEPPHQVERHVDAGGDARRGDDVAVVDEPRLRVDVGPELGERLDGTPVGGRRPAGEEARLCVDERAVADARHERVVRALAQLPLEPVVLEQRPDLAAGVEEQVDAAELGEGNV